MSRKTHTRPDQKYYNSAITYPNLPLASTTREMWVQTKLDVALETRKSTRWRKDETINAFLNPFGLTLRVTKNNVFMVVYSRAGRVLFWFTRGRKNSNFHLYTRVCSSLVRFMFEKLIAALEEAKVGRVIWRMTVYGKAPVRALIQDLRKAMFRIYSFRVAGGLAHNGCRIPKRRRGARN